MKNNSSTKHRKHISNTNIICCSFRSNCPCSVSLPGKLYRNLDGFYRYVKALRELDHTVTITTLPGSEMQKRFVAIARNRHKYVLKALIKDGKITAKDADKFDPGRVKATDAYRSIRLEEEYLYSFMWSPPTASHFYDTCAKISESDFAHVTGGSYVGGVVFTRRVSDANRHKQTLVTGLVLDNETTSAHDVGNDSTIDHIPGYDTPGVGQTDVLDGDKGGIKSMLTKLPTVNAFMHGNFDILFGPFFAHRQRRSTPLCPCTAVSSLLRADWELVGLGIRCCGQFGASGARTTRGATCRLRVDWSHWRFTPTPGSAGTPPRSGRFWSSTRPSWSST